MSNWVMINEDDREFLAHSSGPWKNHKYISKDGKKYVYRKTHGKDPNLKANNKDKPKVTHQAKVMSVKEAKEAEQKRQVENRGKIRERRMLSKKLESNKPKTDTSSGAVMNAKEARESRRKKTQDEYNRLNKSNAPGRVNDKNAPKERTYKKVMSSPQQARDAKRKRRHEARRLNK